jgi:3-oxoadipate enol-lactonase/4-carboxymuconolactone decarboxylase
MWGQFDMFALLNNLTLHYRIDGDVDGVPLVFINSLGSDLRIWDEVAAQLGTRNNIIRYDKRGHGLSDAPPGPYTIHDHATDLLSLLTHLQIEQAVLIGISVGGMIAQDLAAWQPKRVRALVLCDTGAQIGTAQSWNDRIATIEAHGMASIAESVLARWVTPAFAHAQPAAYRGYLNMLLNTSAAGYAATCAALRDGDLTAPTQSINTPTLVLCGDADPSTTPDLNRELASLIPGAQFELIANAAHLPCLEQPTAMATKITTFLSQLFIPNPQSLIPNPYDRGMSIRRAVLGNAHVDRAEANKTDFDADFQRYITESAWGGVWARDGLSRKTRHLLTIALMAALGKEHELAMHIRATKNTGVTQDEVKEVLLQVAVYAGVPAANAAFAVAKKTYAEEG